MTSTKEQGYQQLCILPGKSKMVNSCILCDTKLSMGNSQGPLKGHFDKEKKYIVHLKPTWQRPLSELWVDWNNESCFRKLILHGLLC